MKTFDQMFDEQADAARETIWKAIAAHAETIPVPDGNMALLIASGGAITACGMFAAYLMECYPDKAAAIEADFIDQFREGIKGALARLKTEVPN